MPLFPAPKDVLAPSAGQLAEAPFPLLIHALFVEERTCTLVLRRHALEKRVYFEDGAPVGCTSNLLHETLGRFLVEEGRMDEGLHQEILGQAVESGRRLGELLLERGVVTQEELLRLLQRNLALKILDGFAWTQGTWRVEGLDEEAGVAFRLNPAQLVLTGCLTTAPFDQIAQGLVFFDEQRFVKVPRPPHDLGSLRLSARDRALLQTLEGRPTFGELTARSQLATEDAMRRLYALSLLGFVGFEGEVDETPAPVEEPPAATQGDGDVQAEVLDLFLRHRTLDPFDVLGVAENPTFADLKARFLELSRRYAPWRPDLAGAGEKAEAVYMAVARAWAELADPERRSQALKRRRNAAEARRARKGPDFRIQTDLLDAGAQFREGVALLQDGNAAAAILKLEYAADIEPRRPTFKAHLAWARFLADPDRAWEAALRDLAAATELDARCAEAAYFEGEIRRARGDLPGAETALRRAVKLAPDRPAYVEALRSLARAAR